MNVEAVQGPWVVPDSYDTSTNLWDQLPRWDQKIPIVKAVVILGSCVLAGWGIGVAATIIVLHPLWARLYELLRRFFTG